MNFSFSDLSNSTFNTRNLVSNKGMWHEFHKFKFSSRYRIIRVKKEVHHLTSVVVVVRAQWVYHTPAMTVAKNLIFKLS